MSSPGMNMGMSHVYYQFFDMDRSAITKKHRNKKWIQSQNGGGGDRGSASISEFPIKLSEVSSSAEGSSRQQPSV